MDLYKEVEKQMYEINTLMSQIWIDQHQVSSIGSTSNCEMVYYSELLDKCFWLTVTRWSSERYEILMKHAPLKSQQETLHYLNQS